MASIQDFICFLKVYRDICLIEGLPVLEIGLNCKVTHCQLFITDYSN
jgi:hypothetical protein